MLGLEMKIKKRAGMKAVIPILLALLFAVGCNENPAGTRFNPDTDYILFVDERDGTTYKTVTIGHQTWMAENLNYETVDGKCCFDISSYCMKYGRLYTWSDAISVCPIGWHLPDDAEWQELIDFVGGEKTAGVKLKASTDWYNFDGELAGAGTDDYGFSALPGGYGLSDGGFTGAKYNGRWWSATGGNAGKAWSRFMNFNDKGVGRYNYDSSNYHSVRCVQD